MMGLWPRRRDRQKARQLAVETVLLETRLTIDAVAIGLARALGAGKSDDLRIAADMMQKPADEHPAACEAREHAKALLHQIADGLDASAQKAAAMPSAPLGLQ